MRIPDDGHPAPDSLNAAIAAATAALAAAEAANAGAAPRPVIELTPPKAAGSDEEENSATDAGSTGNRVRLDSSLLPTLSAESVDAGGATWQNSDEALAAGNEPSLTDHDAEASTAASGGSSFPAVLRMTRYDA